MMHRTSSGAQPATAARLKGVAKSLTLDDERTESILREYITLSEEEWDKFDNQDVFSSGEEAGFKYTASSYFPPD